MAPAVSGDPVDLASAGALELWSWSLLTDARICLLTGVEVRACSPRRISPALGPSDGASMRETVGDHLMPAAG